MWIVSCFVRSYYLLMLFESYSLTYRKNAPFCFWKQSSPSGGMEGGGRFQKVRVMLPGLFLKVNLKTNSILAGCRKSKEEEEVMSRFLPQHLIKRSTNIKRKPHFSNHRIVASCYYLKEVLIKYFSSSEK